MGLSKEGELFASVTTSNYPFSYVDNKYNVCNSNTIYLKTNLNNIAVSSNPILCTNPVFVNPEPSLSVKMGGLQGVMPSGKFEMKQVVLHGFDGQIVVTGYRDLMSEESTVLAAFTRYLRTVVYKLPGHKLPVQDKNLNVIDFDILDKFMSEHTDEEKRDKVFGKFKDMFIAVQVQNYRLLKSSEDFFRTVSAL